MDIYIQILSTISYENKYFKWYISLMVKAKERALSKKDAKKKCGYIESHHIIPRSFNLGGETDFQNLVFLSAREHFIAHLLLPKFVKIKHLYFKSKEAVSYFNNNGNRNISFNTKELAWIKQANSIASSKRNKGNEYYKFRNENNPKTKQKRKNIALNSKWVNNGKTEHFVRNYDEYILNGFEYGRLKKPISEEKLKRLKELEERKIKRKIELDQKKLQREKEKEEKRLLKRIPWNKGKIGIYSEETIRKISESAKNRKRLKHSEETKLKISKGNKGKIVSAEGRLNISIAAKNRRKPVKKQNND